MKYWEIIADNLSLAFGPEWVIDDRPAPGSPVGRFVLEPFARVLRRWSVWDRQLHLCFCRKRNDIGLLRRCRCECDALRLRNAVLAPQVAVRFHCQRASIFVPKPTRNGRNVHAAFDAARRKQMPQIVVRDAIRADFLRGAIK